MLHPITSVYVTCHSDRVLENEQSVFMCVSVQDGGCVGVREVKCPAFVLMVDVEGFISDRELGTFREEHVVDVVKDE